MTFTGARQTRTSSRARPANRSTSRTCRSVRGSKLGSWRSLNPIDSTMSAATRSDISPPLGGFAPAYHCAPLRDGAAGRTSPPCCAGTSHGSLATTSSQRSACPYQPNGGQGEHSRLRAHDDRPGLFPKAGFERAAHGEVDGTHAWLAGVLDRWFTHHGVELRVPQPNIEPIGLDIDL